MISYKWTVEGAGATLSCDDEKSMNLSIPDYGVYTVKVTAIDIGGKEMTASYTVIVMKQYLWNALDGSILEGDNIILQKTGVAYPRFKVDAGAAIDLETIVIEGAEKYPQYNETDINNLHIALSLADYTTDVTEEKMTIYFKYDTFTFAMAYSIYVKTDS